MLLTSFLRLAPLNKTAWNDIYPKRKSHKFNAGEPLYNAASVTEEGGHCREVADVERLKKERMYGLSAKKRTL